MRPRIDTPPREDLRAQAAERWHAYKHALLTIGERKAWDVITLRLAWERAVILAALTELAARGDEEAARRLRVERA